ncbi:MULTISPECIES: SHOCT domain-containing protein [unclassified Paenibacillus]|nr:MULTISPECIES: SHOCT domain-containing protein [unclassified Paenibacillus]
MKKSTVSVVPTPVFLVQKLAGLWRASCNDSLSPEFWEMGCFYRWVGFGCWRQLKPTFDESKRGDLYPGAILCIWTIVTVHKREVFTMMDGMMMDPSMMVMMCIMMYIGAIIFILIVGATVYVVARLLMMKSRVVDRPLMMLKERYVRGEINDDEYLRMRKVNNDVK